VSYFTAVLAREGDKWFARAVDLEDLEDLTELTDAVRVLETDDETILVFIEREDAWWSVIRVDADDDPRVFVSDVTAAAAGPYAALLAVDSQATDDEYVVPGTYGGDSDVLIDLGTSPDDLLQICEDEMLPMDALASLAEAGGFAEILDSLR
jgi:putative tRNA adenosine deaminase-associated protein